LASIRVFAGASRREAMKRHLGSSNNGRAETYRRMLQARRAEVLSSLGVKFDTLAAMGRVAEEDQAQLSHDEFISLSLNSLDHQQLGLINEALDRIKVGDFGACMACGDAIPSKRLQAIPWARYCISCQEEMAGSGTIQNADSAEVVTDR
jgi:DnaK suppressor protein